MKIMKKRIIYAFFILMIVGISLAGCRSKQLCPAYTDNNSNPHTEETFHDNI